MKTTANNQDNPHFDLPLENELLMLRLRAEFGAECITSGNDIPPLVVNEFLKSVYEFEKKFREPRPLISIYEKLNRPAFKKVEDLPDKQLSRELKKVLKYMRDRQMELDVMGEYSDRDIYRFITEEFFNHEIEDLNMQGFIHHFCYEDFHPNHEMDIRSRSIEFLHHWFDKSFDKYSWELATTFIHPDTREFSREDILQKLQYIFDAYIRFTNCAYDIKELSFEWDDNKEEGKALVKGYVQYYAEMENRELVHKEGEFQLYFSSKEKWWNIFYFIFPGFSWQG